MKDKTAKTIMDVLSAACKVSIREVCILNHDETSFKAYVHGTSWYGQSVYDVICKAWDVNENDVSIKLSPEGWWPLGSTGYVIEVTYNKV